MIIASTKDHLAAIVDSNINKVGLALDLVKAIESAPKRGVECYVIPVSEVPGSNERSSGPARQKLNITIGVVIGIKASNDPSGERSADDLEAVRTVIRDNLFGWTPEGAKTHFLLGKSSLVKMVPGGVWWLDQFTTTTQRTGTQHG
ncbi:MAG: phage tail terminator protein [Neptuniibacter sp.]